MATASRAWAATNSRAAKRRPQATTCPRWRSASSSTLAAPYGSTATRSSAARSVGAAIYGVDASDVDELLHKADLALYRAKADGRGGFSFYDAQLDRAAP